jgi:DUF4097 and DUF4098 domain-containing protein YvlB
MFSNKRSLIVLIVVAVLAIISAGGSGSHAQTEVTQNFDQTYPMSANGRISVENINGYIHVASWDRPEVKVVAVKRAYRQDRLDEVQIKIDANADSIRIKSEYPYRNQTFRSDDRRTDNPAVVDYTLTVPRGARLDSIEAINGEVVLDSLTGDVRASAINGNLNAANLTGDVRLSTINSQLNATFTAVSEANGISLNSVNGSVVVTLPSDTQAQLKAETVHGGISNDFGVPVQDGKYFGHNLSALLGNGGARVRLSNVNGSIRINRAADGRTPSAITNLLNHAADEDYDNDADNDANDAQADMAEALVDAQNDLREAERELEQAGRELEQRKAELNRATDESRRAATEAEKETAREAEAEAREELADAEGERREAEREIEQVKRQIQDLTQQRDAMPPVPPAPPAPPVSVRDTQREADRASRQVQRDAQRAARDVQREAQRAARDAQREMANIGPEIARATREAAEIYGVSSRNFRAVAREEKTFSVKGTPTVNAETFDGTLSVRSWDRSEVSYSIVKRAENDERLSGIQVAASQDGDNITIKITFDKTMARHFGNSWSTNATASLEIMVPRNATVRAGSGDGHVRVDGVNGNLDIHTGDGAITVSDSNGRLNLQTGDGRINLDNCQGEVDAKTGDGSISLSGQFTKLSASTGEGSIALTIPAGSNVTIESNSAEVKGDGVNLVPNSNGGRGPRRWNIGAGGPVFTLRTGEGRITIRQS